MADASLTRVAGGVQYPLATPSRHSLQCERMPLELSNAVRPITTFGTFSINIVSSFEVDIFTVTPDT